VSIHHVKVKKLIQLLIGKGFNHKWHYVKSFNSSLQP